MPGCESKLIVGNSVLEHPRVKRITPVTLGTPALEKAVCALRHSLAGDKRRDCLILIRKCTNTF